MAMNYDQLVQAVLALMVEPDSATDFQLVIPRMIEYGELRMYRELDFIHTTTTGGAVLTPNVRNVTIPSNIIIVRSANLITPASETDPAQGVRRPLQRVGYDYIDMVWPQAAVPAGVPSYPEVFALLSNTEAVVGPSPDASYTVEFVGTFRPAALSPSNVTTYLTENMPDAFLSACMIWASEYQQDQEAKARYEKQYNEQLLGVNIETLRQKAASVSWSPYQPTPQANVARERGAGPAVGGAPQ